MQGMSDYLQNIGGNPFRGTHEMAREGAHLVYETRQLLGQCLGIKDPNKICFTHNATYALNILLKGFVREGDHVITSSYDHNSVLRPLHVLQKKGIITFSVWKCDTVGRFSVKDLEGLIRPNTRLLFFSHASNVIGTQIPLPQISALAKERGLTLGLDCTQSAGHLPLEVEKWGIDMAAGTCHKALYGPPGLGFLYVNDCETVDSLIQGGGGFLASSWDHPEVSPAKYEAGTINYLGIAGLHRSLQWLFSKKTELHEQLHYLSSLLRKELLNLPHVTLYGEEHKESVPILSFTIKGIAASQIETFLEVKHTIIVRSGLHCAPLMHEALGTLPQGTVRLSLGPFNQEEDVHKIVQVLSKINDTL